MRSTYQNQNSLQRKGPLRVGLQKVKLPSLRSEARHLKVQHFNYFFHRPPFPPPPIYLSLVVEGFVCINKMGGETTLQRGVWAKRSQPIRACIGGLAGPPKPEGQGKEARSMCFLKTKFFQCFPPKEGSTKKNTLPPPELAQAPPTSITYVYVNDVGGSPEPEVKQMYIYTYIFA